MSGGEASNSSVIKSVVIGVSTSVLTAVILYYLGIEKSAEPPSLPNPKTVSGYEEQLRQTGRDELSQRQKELEKNCAIWKDDW